MISPNSFSFNGLIGSVSILFLIFHLNQIQCFNESEQQDLVGLNLKLDKVLKSLSLITNKYDELSKTVHKQCCCHQQLKDSHKDITSIPLPTKGSILVEAPIEEKNQGDATVKRIENNEDPATMFHVNKLASDFNAIPSSSREDEEDNWLTNEGFATGMVDNSQRQLISSIGQQYEAIFGAALDNLSKMVKEQLASFRLGLSKMMNRVVDHSYQYNTISNQLLLIKDECSLAAAAATYDSSRVKGGKPEDHKASIESDLGESSNTIRASEMSMMARLMSQELKALLLRPQLSTGEDCDSLPVERLLNETRLVSRKLVELDSVVKQSALMLSKASVSLAELANDRSSSGDSSRLVVTYNNSDAAGNKTGQLPQSRWFSGSKVPGKNRTSEDLLQQQQQTRSKCQSKTSLIRPASCQQLRLAGANCTGQYYVFVRGFIRHVYCDMNMDLHDQGGGWTVVLRRIDKSLQQRASPPSATLQRPANQLLELFKASQVSFNLDWANYKSGFGHLTDWGEFFAGLDVVHQLTSEQGQSSELQLDLETERSEELHLRFQNFSLQNEQSQFSFSVGSCNATSDSICRPISLLNGAKFSAFGAPTNGSCGSNHTNFGWWFREPECGGGQWALTRPVGRQADGSEAHVYWPNWIHSDQPIRRLTLKVRNQRRPLVANPLES